MVPFFFIVILLAGGIPPAVAFAHHQGWLPAEPSFLYETAWLVAIITAVIFVYLYRSRSASWFVQLYLLSMAVKLLAYFAYNLVMILEDRQGAVPNVLYFLALYFVFTAVEIAFLYPKISRPPRA